MVELSEDEIRAKAIDLWYKYQVASGFYPSTLPEDKELKGETCPWTGKSWWETAEEELKKSPEQMALEEQIRHLEQYYPEAVKAIEERAWASAEKIIRDLKRKLKASEKAREEIIEKSRREIEEWKVKFGRTPKPFRVVRPFVWGVWWKPGQVLRTQDWEWAVKMVEAGYLEPIPEMTEEHIAKLEELFKGVLQRELGRVPEDVMKEFQAELERVKVLPFEEASGRIERLAMDIAGREKPKELAWAVEKVKKELEAL